MKVLALVVAAYAFSPIDLIPDFIPVLGYLDDLILVPLGIWLVVSLIPEQAMAEYRAKAGEIMQRPHDGKIAAIAIIAIWMSGAALLCWFGFVALGSMKRNSGIRVSLAASCPGKKSFCPREKYRLSTFVAHLRDRRTCS